MNKNHKPLVSIITVVYNGDEFLEETINSVISQTYKVIEYIIVDGGSTDGTIGIIDKYKNYINKFVSEPDKGLYDAMNKGIGMASGVLIGMINSDDWYELDAVETMVNAYLEKPTKTIFHADRYDIFENGEKALRKFNSSVFKFKYYGMTYNHPSMFVTKSEYAEHSYNINYRSHADYNFLLEAFFRDKSKIYYINKAIVNYRLNGISANIGFWEANKDVFRIRFNSGMNIFECCFAFILMRIVKFKTLLTSIFN